MYDGPIQDLIAELSRLPGIGPKGAQRIAFFLLDADAADVQTLADAIVRAKQTVKFCQVCFNATEDETCRICRDPRRDQTRICVVEESTAVEYLCAQTGGQAMRLYRPRGIGELIKSTAEIRSPLYSFSFTSKLPTDFGRAWLPLEIEVYLMERSGRDNTGYFPPLE